QVLQATAGGRVVFELELHENGDYEFRLFDQVDHDPPYDVNPPGSPVDPFVPGDAFPLRDQNTDLIDNDDVPAGQAPRNFDISELNLGALIDFTDYDGDSVTLDEKFTVTIRDDMPKLLNGSGSDIRLTVDEDDISTLNDGILGGSLGTSPND